MSEPNDHTHTVEVDAPVRVAYNQWTQFEDFPRFMEGVESVTQVADDRLSWVVEIGGVTREFDTVITEQTPDHRIAWATETGPTHSGVVTFHRIDDDRSRVTLQMDFDPEGFLENVAEKLGFVSRRVEGDMARFATLVQDRTLASGAWRGVIT
ncbi:MAG: SRPBCC family protein [Acidimicrobiales bacterium]